MSRRSAEICPTWRNKAKPRKNREPIMRFNLSSAAACFQQAMQRASQQQQKLALAATAILVLTLVACGSSNAANNPSGTLAQTGVSPTAQLTPTPTPT